MFQLFSFSVFQLFDFKCFDLSAFQCFSFSAFVFRNRLYYSIKPLIPWSVRMGMRRWFARRKRERVGDVWPVYPGSEKPPVGWPGWPEGKRFAFLLTHDVEGPAGLAKVKRLVELEMSLGFRSCFNFIPEGSYRVTRELRDWLTAHGFGVGVHDFHHDGKLFTSRSVFAERAVGINRYLKEWGAPGFRSGFMLKKLDWIHELNVQYDASTFDTDPFEPQPHGQHTIFPFWVACPEDGRQNAEDSGRSSGHSPSSDFSVSAFQDFSFSRSGYVELPYTLPQDSTLFLLFQEATPKIWLNKLDWIAQHGGMALVNVHPDYLRFPNEPLLARTYPMDHYRLLLEHVRGQYAGQFWHVLPRDVAAHARTLLNGHEPAVAGASVSSVAQPAPAVSLSPVRHGHQTARARILMIVENNFPQDNRVRNEAFLLNSAGYHVSVLCYRKDSQPAREAVNGVEVYRLPRFELFQKTPSGKSGMFARLLLQIESFIGYLAEYAYFTTLCFLGSLRISLKSGFDVIHVHNPPDTLFLVGLPFKLLGKKFVFDHHDLCPELYQSRYGAERGFYTSLLTIFEWCSLKLADVTIATNETYKEKQIERAGKLPSRVFVVRNGPNEERMKARPPAERLRRLNKAILCYIGSLNPQDGVDYLLRSLSHLRYILNRDDFYCVIMGSGDSLKDLRSLAKQLKLEDFVELTGFISDEDLMANLAAADICVDPDPSSPLNDVSTWIKIMEYMACGKPIVSFDLKESRYSARDAALFVPPNDELAFAKAIARLMDDSALRQKMGSFGRQRVERELQWSVTGQNLLSAYAALLPGK